MRIDDAAAREAALDPGRSFAVRAPAGSGKTSLLTQRLLCLLTTVEAPEQVVAITFTRKAAEEMRARIIEALELARGPVPDDAFRARTHRLASAVLAHDEARGWQLAAQPARLRIMTIDALNQHLVRQMPITAGLAGPRAIVENASDLYREAARDALGTLTERDAGAAAVMLALTHVENDWARLEALLADMLARRDQWLRMLGQGSERERLEHAHAAVAEDVLAAVRALFAPALAAELVEVVAYAGAELARAGEAAGDLLAGLRALPEARLTALPVWQAMVDLLLKRDGDYRRQLNKNQGFPAGKGAPAEMKARLLAIIERLSAMPQARPALQRLVRLPVCAYGAGEWPVVLALLTLLKTATAHLMVQGERGGQVDFTAFALAALQALGEPEQPTDLALSMDYRVQHLLIDEFQDTSVTQFELVQRLTAGWTGDDGRSLFLVGDPMQSIYRFRQAEVSLFNRVLTQGRIGEVPITPLALEVNFRAQAALVDWINAAIPPALAAVEAFDLPFVLQRSVHPASGPACSIYPALDSDAAAEAAAVETIVREIRAQDAAASIAILVRSRSHLGSITTRLVEAGIPLAAREIRPLLELPVVGDLLALTRALLHEADSIAWLAVLRAPCCGLGLAALTTIGERAAGLGSVRAAMHAVLADGEALDADDMARLRPVAAVLERAMRALAGATLTDVVEDTWLALGGPGELSEPAQAADVRAYFGLLEELVAAHALVTAERLEERMAERYSAPPPAAPGAVQVMTMHRAKGLEFDHVIIPGLGRRPRADARRLLMWRERLLADDERALLLAPLPHKGESPLYDFLRAEEQADAAAEAVRLLYVAVTRARRRLYLLGHARVSADGEPIAAKGSFLALLWPQLATVYHQAAADAAGDTGATAPVAGLPPLALRRRVRRTWPAADTPAPDLSLPPLVEFDWAGSTARHIGTVVHALFQFADDMQGAAGAGGRQRYARGQLRGLGVPAGELDAAVGQVEAALAKAGSSARGRWLMDPGHTEVRAEWRLSHRGAGGRERVIIDRSFVDAEGVRWIVDFKTGQHSGSGLEAYLDSEVLRYRAQLERYARIVASREARPIRLGLYFPLLDAWREWPYEAP